MTEVNVVQGAPGAGKTYKLTNVVERALKNEKRPTYRNFTRSGTEDTKLHLSLELDVEAEDTAVSVDKYSESLADKITGTLHSLAFQIAKRRGFVDSATQIIQPDCAPRWESSDDRDDPSETPSGKNMYVDFCERNALNFSTDPLTPVRAALRDDDIDQHEYHSDGNALFGAFEWARMIYPPGADRARKARKAPVDIPIPGSRVEKLYRDWESYKDEQDRVEHSDYIDFVIESGCEPEDVDVLCIDEYQDLSPLEHKLVWEWISNDAVEEIWLAGDVNQSIYSFRGARPGFMKKMRESFSDQNVHELTESRRCGSRISRVADSIVDNLDGSVPMKSHQDAGRGDVRERHCPSMQMLADAVDDSTTKSDDVMVLTRSNKIAAAVIKGLMDNGVMYSVLGSNDEGWSRGLANLVVSLVQAKNSKPIPSYYYKSVRKAAPSDAYDDDLIPIPSVSKTIKIQGQELLDAFAAESVQDVIDVLELTDKDKNRVTEAVRRDQKGRGNVEIGTVHASKGLEADSVMVIDAYPGNVAREYARDDAVRAEERRVGYVAVTRAKDEFSVVRGLRDEMPPGHSEQWPVFQDVGGGSA